MGTLRIGTSSWADHAAFYPPGTKQSDQLSYYATQFSIVEVNSTYYHIPTQRTVANWVARTPDGFVFDIKPPRQLTKTPAEPHAEAPEPDEDFARQFAFALEPLMESGKLGVLTFQFPPSYRNTEPNRDYLRSLSDLLPGFDLAVEFRRIDWLDEEHRESTLALLRDTGLHFTMADEPQVGMGSVPPVFGVTNEKTALIRFHGRNAEHWYDFSGTDSRRFDWEYSDEELSEWLPNINDARALADDVHIFFNTNVDGQGPRNIDRLSMLLGLTETKPMRSLFDLSDYP